jgi:hypothetical protein
MLLHRGSPRGMAVEGGPADGVDPTGLRCRGGFEGVALCNGLKEAGTRAKLVGRSGGMSDTFGKDGGGGGMSDTFGKDGGGGGTYGLVEMGLAGL